MEPIFDFDRRFTLPAEQQDSGKGHAAAKSNQPYKPILSALDVLKSCLDTSCSLDISRRRFQVGESSPQSGSMSRHELK
jgi:hypothetical protein